MPRLVLFALALSALAAVPEVQAQAPTGVDRLRERLSAFRTPAAQAPTVVVVRPDGTREIVPSSPAMERIDPLLLYRLEDRLANRIDRRFDELLQALQARDVTVVQRGDEVPAALVPDPPPVPEEPPVVVEGDTAIVEEIGVVEGVPAPVVVERAILETGLFRTLGVNFRTGRAEILPEAAATLDVVGEVLARYPELRLEVAGHTDAVGGEAYNERLSERRAEAVATYLDTTFALPDSQLVAQGYGEAQPIASNETETGRALNRRVGFRVLNPDAAERYVQERRAEAAREELADAVAAGIREAMGETAALDTVRALAPALPDPPQPPAELVVPRETPAVPRETTAPLVVEASQPFPYRFRGAGPLVGVRGGDEVTQRLLGFRTTFRNPLSRTILAPEVALGTGDGTSLNLALTALRLPTDRRGVYAGAGIALGSDRGLKGLEASLLLALGYQRGPFFAELNTLDFLNEQRFLAGFRIGL